MPILAWVAVLALVVRWYFRRWETRLVAERSFRLRFPLSSMVFLSRKVVIEELLNDPEIQAAIAHRAEATGLEAAVVKRHLRRQARELVPAFKAVFYFSIGYWLARTLLLTFYRVKLVGISGDNYEKIGRDATVVLFMNHRSNMDVLLVNFLLCRHSTIAHAAGEWARLWPLHHLVRLAGNYVVDRDSNDPLYRLLLKRYVQMAVARGIHLGIFPEGSLSRDGLLQPLNFGLLNYVSTARWPGFDRDVVFIPVGFNYDQVPEQQRLVFEDEREFSERSKIYVALGSVKFVLKFLVTPLIPRHKRFGWACANFGEPISLKAWQRARGIDLKSLTSEQRRKQVEMLGSQLMENARQLVPVLPVHVLAMTLLEEPGKDWLESDLFARASLLKLALETAGAPIFAYDTDETTAWRQALRRLEQLGMISSGDAPAGGTPAIRVVDAQLPLLHYYANTIAHYLGTGSATTSLTGHALESSDARDSRNKYLKVIYESHQRMRTPGLEDRDFFEHFYRRFLASSPVIAEKFRNTDMERQRLHLQQSLEHMLDFYITEKPGERLRQLARSHSRAGHDIASELYDLWSESLIAAVREFDPGYDASVELAWRTMVAPGIGFMRSQFERPASAAAGREADSESIEVEDQGINRWIDQWSARTPDKLALASEARLLSYGQLAAEVRKLAAGLQHRLGVVAGDRVALISPNRVEFFSLVFACARLGATVVPINYRTAPVEQEAFLKRADVKAVFVDAAFAPVLIEAAGDYPTVVLEPVGDTQDMCDLPDECIDYRDLLSVPSTAISNRGRMDSPLFIVFTSGSTGQPKGAVLTQGAIHWNALNSRLMHDLGHSDHVIATLPFFHVGGINIQALPALQVGATVSVVPKFDAGEFVRLLEREKPTLTVLVPAQMQQLLQLPNWHSADLSSLKAVATGSTMVGKELLQAWANKGLPVIQIYGCTESGPIAIHQTVEDSAETVGSVGYASLYTEVMITDQEGREVDPGREGEIRLSGPHLMSHYWGDETATGAILHQGWLSTGDLGYKDEAGRFHVVGRIKRLIISGGENIHPEQVERVLEQHPGILEAAVVGVPDPKWQEVPIALLVTAAEGGLDEAAIQLHLNQNLGRYKHPRRLIQVDALPRTALGKVDYPRINAQYGSGDS